LKEPRERRLAGHREGESLMGPVPREASHTSGSGRFLRDGLTLTPSGRSPFPEMVFSKPKKLGRTVLAALVNDLRNRNVRREFPTPRAIAVANEFEHFARPRLSCDHPNHRSQPGAYRTADYHWERDEKVREHC
jgi:hypothetical protein